MRIVTPYPGQLLEAELGLKVIRIFLYKFARDSCVKRRKIYDKETKRLTDKSYLHFNLTPPYWGSKFTEADRTDRSIFSSFLLSKENNIFFMPHYHMVQSNEKNANIYCSTSDQVVKYFDAQKEEEAQNIYIFDASFTWFIDVFDELRKDAIDGKDYHVLFYQK